MRIFVSFATDAVQLAHAMPLARTKLKKHMLLMPVFATIAKICRLYAAYHNAL